jgi:hypothetical protein
MQARFKIGIVVSNPTRGMDVCPCFFCAFIALHMADKPSKESYHVYQTTGHNEKGRRRRRI